MSTRSAFDSQTDRVLQPGDGRGAPVGTSNPDHQPRVPMAAGVPPYCTCGVVGGNGIDSPLLADHLKEMAPDYGTPRSRQA